jgi:hypothetical protein
MAMMSKSILDNVPLQELDVNYIKKFNNYAYGNNYNNDYPIPSFFPQISYGNRPNYAVGADA